MHVEFEDVINPHESMVPQVKRFAELQHVELEDGWKVEVAKLAKVQLIKKPELMDGYPEVVEAWTLLFKNFED